MEQEEDEKSEKQIERVSRFRLLRFLKRKRVLITRLLIYSIISVAAFLFILWAAITAAVSNEDLHGWIVSFVEEQTGGKLEISEVDFNVLTGIILSDVKFFPPKHGDTRGYINGGKIEAEHLAKIDALQIVYSIPSALVGRLHLKALQLVSPDFALIQKDGVFNFDSIIEYRKNAFPVDPTMADKEREQPESDDEPGTTGFLPFSPSLLFLPFNIRVKDVGINDLNFKLVTIKGKNSTKIEADGLSIDLGLEWTGFDSEFRFSATSPLDEPFILSVKSNDPDNDVILKSTLSSRLELVDLRHLSFDFLMKIDELDSKIASYKDVEAGAKIRINVDEDFRRVSIDTFSTDLANSVLYDLIGTISLPEESLDTISLDLTQSLNISLDNASKLVKPFVPALSTSGEIRMDDLVVKGEIRPQEMASGSEKASLPTVSGTLKINGVAVRYPGLRVSPISGSVSINAGEALGGGGSQLDTVLNLLMPKVHLTQNTAGSTVTVGTEDLSAKATIRFLYPQMIAPIVKFNAEADHLIAKDSHGVNVDVPLFIDVDGEGRKDLEKAELSANIEMTELADISVNMHCSKQCTSFRTNNIVRLESLANLYAIAMPLVGNLDVAEFLPSKLAGNMDFQFTARGRIPNPLENDVATLLREGHIVFNTQFGLLKLTTNVPFYKTSLNNFETRFMASGNTANQQFDLTSSFDKLSLSLPVGEKTQKIELDRFSFSSEVENSIAGEMDLENILKQLVTKLKTKIYLGQVSVGDLLPQPLSRLELALEAVQNKLEEVRISSLVAKAPDFGATVNLSAKTSLSDSFMPKNFDSKMETNLRHSGSESIAGGIKTSGEIISKFACNSPDMDSIYLDGKSAFKNFYLTFGKDPAKPLINAQGITGEIPFKQTVVISQLKKKLDAMKTTTSADQEKTESSTASVGDAVDKYFKKHDNQLDDSNNVVALVDYGTIRPFYPDRKPLFIKKLEVANLEMSNLEFDVELRQNWFSLNQFVIGFLGGKIQGDFQLSFDPLPKLLRTSLHLTRLNTRKLLDRFPNLKGKKSWSLLSDPNLDATVHLKYDIAANDISGGMEITSIGKEQMQMMLYYVDPHEKNPTISDIRTALNFGEVRLVSIPIKNGEIDLSVDVRVLSVPIPTPKLTRFPVSQIVQNFKDQANAQPDTEEEKGDDAPQKEIEDEKSR